MTKTVKLTPKMTEILVQAAAREDGNAQMFTKTDSQGQSLKRHGFTVYSDELRQMVITDAGREFVSNR